jgi:hypothetical protein
VDNLDPPAISAAATAQNWKIWRDVHSVPVSLGSRKYSAGAISQSGDARQPLTHCDSYRPPGMLLFGVLVTGVARNRRFRSLYRLTP